MPRADAPLLRITSLLGVLAALLAPSALAADNRGGPEAVTTLRPAALSVTRGLVAAGRTDPGRLLHVTVALRNEHDADEQHLYDALYAAAGPQRYLSPAEFRDRFRPATTRLRSARAFLTGRGLRVDTVGGADDVWSLSGTARQVELTFGVRLLDYRRDGRTFFAPDRPPTVPAALGIQSVVGLDDWFGARPPARTAQTDCADAAGCIGMLSVRDLWSVYDVPRPTGRGESVGILGEGDTRGPIADLREFEQLESLAQVRVRVVHADGARGSYDDTRGRDEWSMDLEASTGMAPSVRQATLYFGGSLFNVSLLNDIAAWASDARGPRQASMSITECEDTPLGAQTGGFTATPEFVVPADRLLRQAALEGRTLFAASGDLGSSCPIVPVMPVNGNGAVNEVAPVVGYPAASPYAVAVGGTVLYASFGGRPHRITETGWTASGGGQSVSSPQPAYQRAVAPPGLGARPCLQRPDGSTAPPTVACRMVPDVAALSGDVLTNGMAIVRNGAPNQVGAGTSLSAPLWSGIWARVQSGRPAAYRRGFGFANPALYRVASSAFFDIGGGPSSPPTSNGAYVTMPGYDYVTGLGVPDVAALLRSLSRKAA